MLHRMPQCYIVGTSPYPPAPPGRTVLAQRLSDSADPQCRRTLRIFAASELHFAIGTVFPVAVHQRPL